MSNVLVADDDEAVLHFVTRFLQRAGQNVTGAPSAAAALEAIERSRFDVIVSDIMMPGLSGLDLLREVRKRDLDVPVILITGAPQIETAIAAVELGAFKYLPKPFDPHELVAAVDRASRLHRLAIAKRQALEIAGHDEQLLGDRASLEDRFQSAFTSLWIAFQPIVSLKRQLPIAFEGLLRTEEPTLRNPQAFVTAAERLGRVLDLGRTVRATVAAAAAWAPADVDLFVNLHPSDLSDPELLDERAPLSLHAKRVVLEITERASLEGVKGVLAVIARLRSLGFRIAIDDLGAGYAGLTSLTSLEPDVAKLDVSLVRGIDTDSRRQRIVGSLTELCESLSMKVVIEGIETASERDTVRALGADAMQGYHFAKPGRGFVALASSVWS
jgi:EAL domain-containing protein (putative c-di-GMP-specific phosphodiesterase class I)